MPEGDTIFRAARAIRKALAGRVVTEFDTQLAQLTQKNIDHPVQGRTVIDASSMGKHLLIDFSDDLTLRTHMLMSGSWHLYRPGERWFRPRRDMRVMIATDQFVAVAFNIPIAEFFQTSKLHREEPLRALGPDLLAGEFDFGEAARRIRERAGHEIAIVILTQRVVAGIGNVFKSEILFLAGVNPFDPVHLVSDAEIAEILQLGRKLLGFNVLDGAGDRIVTYTGFRRTTGRSDPGERLWVYGRRGKPCRRCGTPIEYRKQGIDARSTYWCPSCQPLRADATSTTR
jgi:endonuclease VIII